MYLRNLFTPRACSLLLACALLTWPAYSQQDNSSSQAQDEKTVEGTAVSSSNATAVDKSEVNQYHPYTIDRSTDIAMAGQEQEGGSANSSARKAAPVPKSARKTEAKIEDDARRWRLGARAGVGLDPELILFGLHSQMGPIFSRNFFFRPNADFEWGEVTDMVALNFEGVYRMPTAVRGGAWAPYFGGGPSMNFIHQSFQTQPGQARNISFGNFDYETGLNVLMGVQNRHGTFFEIKTSLYSKPAPILRIIVGRNF